MKKLLIFCVAIGFVFALGNTAVAAEWNVPGNFATIQDAIDTAVDGDTIYVHEDTYDECIVINGKDLSLIAIGNVTVEPSSSCMGHGEVIQAFNADVSIEGFIVDATNCMGGIYAKGGLDGYGPVSLNVTKNTVHSYKKNGITVNGPEAYGHIAMNNVQGSGPIGVPYFAQNGIQFGWGATGVVMTNTVTGNWYTGPDWAASGVLLFQADGVMVQGNTIIGCSPGVAIETWCWDYPTASKNRVVKNNIEGGDTGISVAAWDVSVWNGSTTYTGCDPSADNNKIVNNTISATSGNTGIFVGTASLPGGLEYTPRAYNNKIIHNTIEGFATAINETGIATKVHANVVE